jgi:thiol:disulfide interchange protein DsbD
MNARCYFLSTVLVITVLSVVPAQAEEQVRPKVSARLVADAQTVSPGSAFRLGVRLEIEDGWHVYWRYPGGAGLATTVDFELPDGFVVGELEWPLPIAFTQSEGIPGYGYEGSVVLATQIETPPEPLPASAMVRAQVSWLACKGVCVLGNAELEGSFSGFTVDPALREWNRYLPQQMDVERASFSVSTTGGLADGAITLWLQWRGSPQVVEWFPDPSEALEVGEVKVMSRGGLTRIDAKVRQRKGASGSVDSLPSLVVVTDSGGKRRGWDLSTNLKNSEE